MTTETTPQKIDATLKKIDEKAARIRKFRRDASRMADVANKRIARLEKNKLTDSPAYQRYIENGEARFGIRGKSYNEVQAMVSKMEKFLDAKTSTVTGIKSWANNVLEKTGVSYSSLNKLKKEASKVFELMSKTEQYLRQVDDLGSAFDSDQIMDTVRTFVKDGTIDLEDSRDTLDEMVLRITDALKEMDEPVEVNGGWYSLKD